MLTISVAIPAGVSHYDGLLLLGEVGRLNQFLLLPQQGNNNYAVRLDNMASGA